MKAKKIITTIVLLLVAVFSLCGCASIQMVRAIDANGTIIDRMVIELNESKINKAGKTVAEVKSVIKNDIIAFRQYVNDWKSQFAIEDFPELALSLENGILVNDTEVGNKLTIAIEFSNWTMFGLFYGIVNLEDVEYQKAMTDVGPFLSALLLNQYGNEDMGVFLYKYSLVRDEGFVKNLQGLTGEEGTSFATLYEKYKTLTNNYYDIDDLDISQIFAYPDEKLYSNADETEVTGGLTMMMWDLSNKADGFKMEIYKLGPKTAGWYILALIISAVAVVIIVAKFGVNSAKNKVSVKITKEEVEKDEK
ncbi:MAG: hypothetical protein E7354_00715 [Clostridiales bacterium]|nr:hypothetical protein [Clostridiales bacterium]